MATNKKSDGNILNVTAPAGGHSSGDMIEFGLSQSGFVGIALRTVTSGLVSPVAIGGMYQVTKGSGTAWTIGDKLFHTGSQVITDVLTGNHLAGIAGNTRASADLIADLLLSVGPLRL